MFPEALVAPVMSDGLIGELIVVGEIIDCRESLVVNGITWRLSRH
jgi:hypothetical protein